MFTTIIIQPIFNLLVLIYALIPGHNFGLAIILFTILIRLLLWPLLKKQLHHAKAMRALAPELKKIKAAAEGNRQKEAELVRELYKEREVNPFSSLGIILIQLPILIGLYIGLKKIIDNPHQIITFSYSWVHNLGWMQQLSGDIHKFDDSLFGVINLTKKAVGPGGVYWPAIILAAASATAQFFQSKQLLPKDKNARNLRSILKEAGQGKNADQQEVNAAVGRATLFFFPGIIFLASLQLAAALPLYWFVSSTIAYIQQSRILKEDETEAEAIADAQTTSSKASEAENPAKKKRSSKSTAQRRKKRRR